MSERSDFLLQFNRERIETAYLAAVKNGRYDRAILLIDGNSDDARNVARLLGLPIDQVAQDEVMTRDVEFSEALRFAATTIPDLSSEVRAAAAKGLVPVLIVCNDGLICTGIPNPDDSGSG
jgi:hypothetical protein